MNNEIKDAIETAFCMGFVYGKRYGYEGVLSPEMTNKEMSSHWIMAKKLYKKIIKSKLEKQEF